MRSGIIQLLEQAEQLHEVSIAMAIVEELVERTSAANVRAITAVYLRIGALTSVVPSALTSAWELTTDGTPAAGSRLEIERIPLTIACKICGRERTIEHSTIPVCPICGTPSANIVRGRELLITAMEVDYGPAISGRSAEHSAQEYHAGT
ncbi:MAG TPA: hydrogenase maturation nickel metallochaperone HypA [Candidatus Baltobacteraceae bacterium]|nr:hydrogenase maturation nickel metallochaperone HypA [Candidatus Baltobacteraceae bacterium]